MLTSQGAWKRTSACKQTVVNIRFYSNLEWDTISRRRRGEEPLARRRRRRGLNLRCDDEVECVAEREGHREEEESAEGREGRKSRRQRAREGGRSRERNVRREGRCQVW